MLYYTCVNESVHGESASFELQKKGGDGGATVALFCKHRIATIVN